MPNYKISSKKKPYQRRKGRYGKYKKAGAQATAALSRYEPSLISGGWPRLQTGFPQQLKVRLKYVDQYALTSTAGSVATQAFRMNSLFDPDYSGVGHQPYGFDQYAGIYDYYTVLGSKLTCTWSPFTTTDPTTVRGPWNVITITGDSTSATSNPTLAQELPRSDSKILSDKQGCNNVVQTVATYSPVRDLGFSPYENTVGAAVGSNPTDVWYGVAMFNDINSTTSSVMLKAELEFIVLFKGPKTQAQS